MDSIEEEEEEEEEETILRVHDVNEINQGIKVFKKLNY